jgi:hypothetical protein
VSRSKKKKKKNAPKKLKNSSHHHYFSKQTSIIDYKTFAKTTKVCRCHAKRINENDESTIRHCSIGKQFSFACLSLHTALLFDACLAVRLNQCNLIECVEIHNEFVVSSTSLPTDERNNENKTWKFDHVIVNLICTIVYQH